MKIQVLGTVQDGGVPHLGYTTEINEQARKDLTKSRFVDSIMVKDNDHDDSVRYLIGATPDIRFQISGEYLDGVLVPDTFFGNVTGLLHFGKAAMNAEDLEVMCPSEVEEYLQKNDPYRYLLDRENIHTTEINDHDEIDVCGGTIQAIRVPHCGDGSTTMAFQIEGDDKVLFYARDFDTLNDHIKTHIEEADVAIIDGCFYSKDEIDRFEDVPHATIQQTMPELEDVETEIYYTYMNHTNPVLQENSKERQELEDRGFSLVERGMEIEL